MEYGIFNDEGLLEGEFWTPADAQHAAAERYSEDDVTVCEICHDHPDQPRVGCELCDQ